MDLQQPVRGHRRALALQPQRPQRLRLHRIAHQPPRLRADHNLPWRGRLLQPRRQIDRIAGRQPLVSAGDHLPGIHPGAHAHTRAEIGLQLGVEHRDLLTQPGRRAHRPQRVILMQHRHTEHRHHRVTDELSTVPPWPSITARAAPKYRRITCRKLSGSSRSPSAVDPVTSQNNTVTVLRFCRAAGTAAKAAPHPLQNLASGGFSRPQPAQTPTPARLSPTLGMRQRKNLDTPHRRP